MSARRASWIVLAGAILAAPPLTRGPQAGPTQAALLNLAYESPALIAPVLVWTRLDEASGLTVSQVGWSTSLEFRKTFSPRLDGVASLELTPLNAHRSDAVYRDGAIDTALAWSDRALQARVGPRFRRDRHTLALRLVALREWVDGADPALEDSWRDPRLGLEVEGAGDWTIGSDPMRHRWEGWKAGLRVNHFGNWSRAQLSLGWGGRMGPLRVRQENQLFLGRDLDVVGRFLVGGAWELPGVNVLYGYRYGELRVARGLVASGGVDLEFLPGWELGLRGGLLAEPQVDHFGEAIRLSTAQGGSLFTAGWAWKGSPVAGRNHGEGTAFASWTAAFIDPFSW